MSDAAAIQVEGLSKRYRIGGRQEPYRRFTETVTDILSAPFKRIAQLGKPPPAEETIWALHDVSLEVQPGEVLGVIGRNGAGKSTLLKILSRITEPTAGRAEIRGAVGSLLEVGTGFHPELTGRENIFLNGAILGMRKAEIARKFDEIVAFAEVEKFIDTPVKRYSSGMYVRLAFAVAAHLEPEILLIDEVLAVGDAAFQKKCLGKMDDVARSGRTILFVSHNMAAVQGLCSRVAWLDGGALRALGGGGEVIEQYLATALSMDDSDKVDSDSDSDADFVIERVLVRDHRGEPTTVLSGIEPFEIDIQYHARKTIPAPYFWIGVRSQFGHLFDASMLLDDLRPTQVEGRGHISCRFTDVRLLPQTYSVSVGARDQRGMESLTPPQKGAATFYVRGTARDFEMTGELADHLLEVSAPLQIAYEWTHDDGTTVAPKWRKKGTER